MTRSRLSAALSRGEMLIISGGASSWPALTTWTLPFFEERAPDAPVEFRDEGALYLGDRQGAALTLGTYRRTAAALDRPWYVGFGVQDEAMFDALFAPYMETPPFFPSSYATQGYRTAWLYFGSHGSGVPAHTDPQCHPKFSVQVCGVKQWSVRSLWRRATSVAAADGSQAAAADDEWRATVSAGDIVIFFPQDHHATRVLSTNGSLAYTGYLTTPRDTPLIRDFIAAAEADPAFDGAYGKCFRAGETMRGLRSMCDACASRAANDPLRPELCARPLGATLCADVAAGKVAEDDAPWWDARAGPEPRQAKARGVRRSLTLSMPQEGPQ